MKVGTSDFHFGEQAHHYLTCPRTCLCMHHRQKWTHVQKSLHLRTLLWHSLQRGEILACNLRAKETHIWWSQFFLQIQRGGKYLPPKTCWAPSAVLRACRLTILPPPSILDADSLTLSSLSERTHKYLYQESRIGKMPEIHTLGFEKKDMVAFLPTLDNNDWPQRYFLPELHIKSIFLSLHQFC